MLPVLSRTNGFQFGDSINVMVLVFKTVLVFLNAWKFKHLKIIFRMAETNIAKLIEKKMKMFDIENTCHCCCGCHVFGNIKIDDYIDLYWHVKIHFVCIIIFNFSFSINLLIFIAYQAMYWINKTKHNFIFQIHFIYHATILWNLKDSFLLLQRLVSPT